MNSPDRPPTRYEDGIFYQDMREKMTSIRELVDSIDGLGVRRFAYAVLGLEMTPPRLDRMWQAGFSVVLMAQRLTAAEAQDVSVGDVIQRLRAAGLIPTRKGRQPPYLRKWQPRGSRNMASR